ncbi:MAG: hypothetical protein M3071_20825 [Actinomycetota bacterium]|nr:hypothetical protein [Actinomycetota bacterium]
MRHKRSFVGAALAALVVIVAGTALAAAPKKGAKFKGTLAYHGTPLAFGKFHAPLSFKVSSSGTQVLAFKYGSLGCFGAGGFGTKNPYTLPGAVKSFAPMSVSASGSFSAPATKSTYKSASVIVTTSSLAGRFTSPKLASGTITFSQKLTFKGKPSTCGPVTLSFSAKA